MKHRAILAPISAFSEDLRLNQLAAKTGGRPFFLESPAALPGIVAANRGELAKP